MPDVSKVLLCINTCWVSAGQISFKEFLYAVQGWVLDEDEYEAMPDDDQKEKMAAKNAAAQRLQSTSSSVAAIKMDARSLHAMSMKSSMKKPYGLTSNFD